MYMRLCQHQFQLFRSQNKLVDFTLSFLFFPFDGISTWTVCLTFVFCFFLAEKLLSFSYRSFRWEPMKNLWTKIHVPKIYFFAHWFRLANSLQRTRFSNTSMVILMFSFSLRMNWMLKLTNYDSYSWVWNQSVMNFAVSRSFSCCSEIVHKCMKYWCHSSNNEHVLIWISEKGYSNQTITLIQAIRLEWSNFDEWHSVYEWSVFIVMNRITLPTIKYLSSTILDKDLDLIFS